MFIERLDGSELVPTRQAYNLVPFLQVKVAAGGPSAAVSVEIYQVHPLDSAACP